MSAPKPSQGDYDRQVLSEFMACLDPTYGSTRDEPLAAKVSGAAQAFCHCYATHNAAGRLPLELALVVGADGAVSDVAAEPASDLADCVHGALLESRLPPPPSAPWLLQIRTLRREVPERAEPSRAR